MFGLYESYFVGRIQWFGFGLVLVGLFWSLAGVYHLLAFERAEARVLALDTKCQVTWRYQRRRGSIELACEEVDAWLASRPGYGHGVREIIYVDVAFETAEGTDVSARANRWELCAEDARPGDTITVLYDPDNPSQIAGLLGFGDYLFSATLALVGFVLMFGRDGLILIWSAAKTMVKAAAVMLGAAIFAVGLIIGMCQAIAGRRRG